MGPGSTEEKNQITRVKTLRPDEVSQTTFTRLLFLSETFPKDRELFVLWAGMEDVTVREDSVELPGIYHVGSLDHPVFVLVDGRTSSKYP